MAGGRIGPSFWPAIIRSVAFWDRLDDLDFVQGAMSGARGDGTSRLGERGFGCARAAKVNTGSFARSAAAVWALFTRPSSFHSAVTSP